MTDPPPRLRRRAFSCFTSSSRRILDFNQALDGPANVRLGVVWKAFDERCWSCAYAAVDVPGCDIRHGDRRRSAPGPRRMAPMDFRPTVTFYVELIRNTPFLLQLYFFFFGLPSIWCAALSPNDAALLTMVINLGAYATEIVRAGIKRSRTGKSRPGARWGAEAAADLPQDRPAADLSRDLSAAGRPVHDAAAGVERLVSAISAKSSLRLPIFCNRSISGRSRPIWS